MDDEDLNDMANLTYESISVDASRAASIIYERRRAITAPSGPNTNRDEPLINFIVKDEDRRDPRSSTLVSSENTTGVTNFTIILPIARGYVWYVLYLLKGTYVF